MKATDENIPPPLSRPHGWVISALSALLLVGLTLANVFFGSIDIPAADVLAALLGNAPEGSLESIILTQSRLPQVFCAILAGASLATAGLLMQTVFSNPLADPSILGIGTGAALGVAVAMLLMGGSAAGLGIAMGGFLLSAAAAFIGAMAVTFLLLALQRFLPGQLMLLVAGVMLSFAGSSLISMINFWSTAQGVQSYMMWGLGSFSELSPTLVPLFAAIVCLSLSGTWLLSKPLDALLLGEDYAKGLGVDVRRVQSLVLLLTGMLVAVTTAVCGPITFIGLAVPHIARLLTKKSTHRTLLPTTMLWGAIVALACNLIAHVPGDYGIYPINTLTPLIGVPMVFYLLIRERKH